MTNDKVTLESLKELYQRSKIVEEEKLKEVLQEEEFIQNPKYLKQEDESFLEFEKRIKSIGEEYLGNAILEKKKIDKFNGILQVQSFIGHKVGISNLKYNYIYIDTRDTDFKEEVLGENKIRGKIFGSLKKQENRAILDLENIYFVFGNNRLRIKLIYLKSYNDEDYYDYYQRIENIPKLNIGVAKLSMSNYNHSSEIIPTSIYYYNLVSDVEKSESGYIKAVKDLAINLYKDNYIYDLYGEFAVIKDKLTFKRLFIVYQEKEFEVKSTINDSSKELDIFENDKILKLFKKSKEQDIKAIKAIGNIYYKGLGLNINYSKALEFFRLAAQLGDGESSYMMGMMHKKGEGVKVSSDIALEYFIISSMQGYGKGSIESGKSYIEGEVKNLKEAEKWFKKAYEQGEVSGILLLDSMY